MKYKVIFVDWDGTLSYSRFWDRWMGTEKYDRIQQALFVDSRDMVREWMMGAISHGQILQHAEVQTGIPYDDLKSELQYSAENMRFIDDEVEALVWGIREKGVKVVVATDNMDTFRLWTVPGMNLDKLFDGILNSETLGALKTHFNEDGTSMFFQKYLTENNIDPKETVLIDNSVDIAVVKNTGMNFMHVDENVSVKHYLQAILSEISE